MPVPSLERFLIDWNENTPSVRTIVASVTATKDIRCATSLFGKQHQQSQTYCGRHIMLDLA